jgi:hypothetical protein
MNTVDETFETRNFCSFCRNNYLERERRVEQGPGGSICESCLGLCEEVLHELKASDRPASPHRTFCAFCGRRYQEVEGRMAEGPGVSICADCAAELRERWGSAAVKRS